METTFTHIKPSWQKDTQVKNDVSTNTKSKPVEKITKGTNYIEKNVATEYTEYIPLVIPKTSYDVTSLRFWQDYFNNFKTIQL